MTLLEKALAVKEKTRGRTSINPLEERVELALAWLTGEISASQVASVLGMKPSNITSKMTTVLASAYRAGLIKIERVK